MFKKIISKITKKIQKKKQPKKIPISEKKINKYHLIKNDTFDKNVNLKIITSHDSNYNEVGKITTITMKKYATKYNLQFKFVKMPSTGRVQTWNKIVQIKDEIQKRK